MKADAVCRNGEGILSAFVPFFLMTCVLWWGEFLSCVLVFWFQLRTGERKLIRVE
jgi:hypothetical protein